MGNIDPIAKKKYQKRIKNSDKAILVISTSGDIFAVNKATVKLFKGISRKDFMKKRTVELAPEEQSHIGKTSFEYGFEMLQDLWRNHKESLEGEFQFKDFEGKIFWSKVQARKLSFGGDQPLIEMTIIPIEKMSKNQVTFQSKKAIKSNSKIEINQEFKNQKIGIQSKDSLMNSNENTNSLIQKISDQIQNLNMQKKLLQLSQLEEFIRTKVVEKQKEEEQLIEKLSQIKEEITNLENEYEKTEFKKD
ncbi:hypothetical protein M0811_06281 [Anaeramoeba ignava]|uniref:PAS fold domain-containing protein n=1 Tax=Anaeramoeba ignava TaxID=1746090 RepID=A0A9Q0LPH7_ANAIG|nr:hypothetical protein M0811_06281 [Anaeramoeba ignava]